MNLSEEDITDMIIDSRDVETELTADEMFKKLRYKKIHNNDCWLEYKREWCGRIKIILIESNERYIFVQNDEATSMPMSLKELKAINKKVEELGWNE